MNLKNSFVIPSDALCLHYVPHQQVPVHHHLEFHLVSSFSQFCAVWISEQQFPTFHIVIFWNEVRSSPLTYSVPLHHMKSPSAFYSIPLHLSISKWLLIHSYLSNSSGERGSVICCNVAHLEKFQKKINLETLVREERKYISQPPDLHFTCWTKVNISNKKLITLIWVQTQ